MFNIDKLKELIERTQDAFKSEDEDSIKDIQKEVEKISVFHMRLKFADMLEISPDSITNDQAKKFLDFGNEMFQQGVKFGMQTSSPNNDISLN